ncbi:MAG: dienelactone hydrolase family protein [Pirellula sp.]|nr:dienelactone hydrolase family protein [Pirellula sp.]
MNRFTGCDVLLVCFTAFVALVPTMAHSQEIGLSLDAARSQVDFAWQTQSLAIKPDLEKELEANAIQADGKTMPLLIKQFGTAPALGHALYISMHGGGGAPKQVNDQQWKNQIRLYEPEEGYYVAPRAPTDNWNLWHESHMDPLLDRLIAAFVIVKGVDPDRVYLMGYSAGGDGVFQLAPRMSDRWAAVAMMAGHPNETKPDGLRNVPFALYMGGKDSAYGRNRLAKEWEEALAALQSKDPEGYVHRVRIFEDKGHWMDRLDRECLPWLHQQTRVAWPKKVVWVQDDVTHDRLYWLGVPPGVAKAGSVVIAEARDQQIEIRTEGSDVSELVLYLNDHLLNLDQPIRVIWNGQECYSGQVIRTESAILRSLQSRFDPKLAATAILELHKPSEDSNKTPR